MQNVPRLIDSFTPATYDLSITLEREARVFHGIVTIQGSTHQAGHLSLHAKHLEITSAAANGTSVTWKFEKDDELQLIGDSITEGPQTLVISFTGTITDQMHGLYPCYFEHEGVKKELLATQFESHHAREVFPCVDEPDAKATFDLTLTTEQNVEVLGNMPVDSQHEEGNLLVTRFQRSPRMSSYLLAWVVGDMQKVTATTKSGVEVNIWATSAQPVESLDFALDIATRTIDFFDDYFGIPYPLPKSDHVALPDFSSAAMENWGLITYREIALLAHPKTTSISSKQYIATVIAHELSHQWFGNLVTMKWWNDLWLNESFATLMEYLAVDALEPDWDVWLDFASHESITALRRDAIDGVQPVQVEVHHPDEISTIFDAAIVYAKGARLMRMLEVYIGKDAFRTGLSDYFKTYAYKNTEANDLWEVLSKASGKDVGPIMNAWISQPGYPVVNVRSDGLTQSQFFIGEHINRHRLWPIPLAANDAAVPELMTDASLEMAIPETLQLNCDDSSHFITQYSESHLATLLTQLDTLTTVQRLQLLDEQTLLARAGRRSSASLIPLLEAYKNETAESVWGIIGLTLGELKKFVENDEPAKQALRQLSGIIARKEFDRLGWDEVAGEPETDTKLRSTVIGMMLYSEQSDVLAEAARRFDIEQLAAIAPELRSLIIGTAVRYGDDAIVVQLLDCYKQASSADLQLDLALGITSTRSQSAAKLLLDSMKNPAVIRQQDTFRWFVYLMRNQYTRDISWQWLQDNWSWVVTTYSGDKSYDDFPRYAASGLVSEKQLKEYQTFFAPMKQEPALARVIELGSSEIAARVELLKRDTADVVAALLNQQKALEN